MNISMRINLRPEDNKWRMYGLITNPFSTEGYNPYMHALESGVTKAEMTDMLTHLGATKEFIDMMNQHLQDGKSYIVVVNPNESGAYEAIITEETVP